MAPREDGDAKLGEAVPCPVSVTGGALALALPLPPDFDKRKGVNPSNGLRAWNWWLWVQLPRDKARRVMECDESGVTQTTRSATGEDRVRLTWEQITSVNACKQECGTVDQITVVIGDDNQRLWMEVSEDDSGYRELVVTLPRHLPGCPSSDEMVAERRIPVV